MLYRSGPGARSSGRRRTRGPPLPVLLRTLLLALLAALLPLLAAAKKREHREDDPPPGPRPQKPRPNIGDRYTDNSKVAILTYLSEAPKKGYVALQDYRSIEPLAAHSMRTYARRHGYAFEMSTAPVSAAREAYWAKIDLIKETLAKGYDWVLYTDIDVLFLDHTRRLQEFMVDADVITTGECMAGEDRGHTLPIVRSGFMLFRNSPAARNFLDIWAQSYEFYRDVGNPEQSALETLHSSEEFGDRIYLQDWKKMHSYDTCDFGYGAFSMHFPGHNKVERLSRVWILAGTLPGADFDWARDEELSVLAARALRGRLANFRYGARVQPGTPTFDPNRTEIADIQRCLANATAEEYEVDADYNFGYHRYAHYYEFAWPQNNIPSVVYFTVPARDKIPENIQANIDSWAKLNPGFRIVVHDDADMDRLARLLLPTIYAVWKKLLPVQKADIYRYIVTGLLGGYYGDADTVCKRPILQWGHGGKTAFVSGVEAQNVKVEGEKYHPGQRTVQLTQYAFASAAFHPIMLDLLAKIVSFADVIVASSEPTLTDTQRLARILATTGPVIFTDCIVQYACYINASSTPNTLWDGGSVPGLRIFGIEGFGAGQYHSLAPPATDKRVLVHHVFGASKALKGEAWFRQKREAAAKEKEKEKAGVPGKAPA